MIGFLLPLVVNSLLSKEQDYVLREGWLNGVNFGGWLVTEPSWMFDQFSAPAENDLVTQWRQKGGDNYAIQTFKNHWAGYIPDSALDAIQEFGITHVRMPVGYWIVDAPVNVSGATMYDFGFQEEGFVTGGINYAEAMISKLKKRGIKAVIDFHAVPGGGSSCQSYSGVMESNAGNSFWQGSPMNNHNGGCGSGGPYSTTRSSSTAWMQIGQSAMLKLTDWVVSLQANPAFADVVVGIEMVNEPGLGWWGQQGHIEDYLVAVVPQVQGILSKAGLSHVHVDLNFIGPNDSGAGSWISQQKAKGVFASSPDVQVDFHNYYNWAGPQSWESLGEKVCGSNAASPWNQYVDQPVWIGEWSDATNLDSPQFTNIDDPDIAANLARLHANQMSLYYTAAGVIGQFYWSVRMGSGWQPWPTEQCPQGCQLDGTSHSKSLSGFRYRVWNLLELIANDIVKPLSAYQITGRCQCNGCAASPPVDLHWQAGEHCMYAQGCDFTEHDIGNTGVDSDKCSESCFAKDGCTAFGWTDYNGGTCWMKGGELRPADAHQSTGSCGIMAFTGEWTSANGSQIAVGCDFIDNDIANSQTTKSACADACKAHAGCTNFVWASNDGTCYLKDGRLPSTQAIPSYDGDGLCGILQ